MKLPEIEAKLNRSSGLLDLSMCDLKNVDFLKKLSNSKFAHKIKKIDLSDNSISTMSAELDFFPPTMHTTVQEINLASNKLSVLPKCLGAFINLKKLDMYANDLVDVDAAVIGRLAKLSWLDISGNKNIEAKFAKMVQSRLSHEEIADLIKSETKSEFKILEKKRVKRQKQDDKKLEKARLAEKARLKEERRLVWEESQKNLKSEDVESESCDDESESGVESDADSEVECQIKGKDQAKSGSNFVVRFFGAILSFIWFLISKTVMLSLCTIGSGIVTVIAMYYVCTIFPANPDLPNYENMLCPMLTVNLKGAVMEWIEKVA